VYKNGAFLAHSVGYQDPLRVSSSREVHVQQITLKFIMPAYSLNWLPNCHDITIT